MDWLALTIVAVFSRAAFGVATKVISTKVEVTAITLAVLLTGSGAVLALVFSPLLGGLNFAGLSKVWPIALLMIISSAVGNILYFKGLERMDASNAQVIFSSILVWSTILSTLFLGSAFSLLQLLGVLVLLVAILLIQYQKNSKIFGIHSLYVLVAAVMFAVFQVTSAELAKTISVGAYTVLAYLGGTIIVFLVYRSRVMRDLRSLTDKKLSAGFLTLLVGSLSLMYAVFAYLAYRVAPDRGVVVLLLTSQVVVGVILAVIVLRERNAVGRKIVAGTIAVIGGLLIKS